MALKHDFAITNSQTNMFWGAMLDINNATSGMFGWAILLLIFAVSSYVFMRKTQDFGKSLLSGLHITTILAILLFYAGKITTGITIVYPLVSEVVMLTLLVAEAVSVGGMYFLRNKGS